VPVVNIGIRQNRRLRGDNVVDVSHDRDEILKAIKEAIHSKKYLSSNIYGDGDAGNKIAKILAETELSFSKTISY